MITTPPPATGEASEPRFFIDHGVIHDRVTGRHVRSSPDDGYEDGISALLALLNGLASSRTAARADAIRECMDIVEDLDPLPDELGSFDWDGGVRDAINAGRKKLESLLASEPARAKGEGGT
jgi:hypothetical protein